MPFTFTCNAAGDLSDAIRNVFNGQDRKQQIMTLGFFSAALFFSIVPFETAQLAFALFGALTYALLQSVYAHPSPRTKGTKLRKGGNDATAAPQRPVSKIPERRPPAASRSSDSSKRSDRSDTPKDRLRRTLGSSEQPQARQQSAPKSGAPLVKLEVRKPSLQPIAAPVFNSQGWDAEVEELIKQISPSPEGDRVIQQIADFVQQTIRGIIPEAEVTGFTSGDLARGTAFGVAVPDVDIVVSVSPQILAARLQARFNNRDNKGMQRLDMKKLQKSAIRACTDRLVSSGTIKFRRSAFRGEEPKVTLLVPASFGVFKEAIPVDFTVNVCTPLYNAALLTECGKKDLRTKSMILMVKRWAKDRGVCHAAKGHLSPYPWSLLAIYFLQVGDSAQPLLPPVEDFEASVTLMTQPGSGPKPHASTPADQSLPYWTPPSGESLQKPVGDLFKDFFFFYAKSFDWRNECICVRTGKRGPPGLSLPLHIILPEDGGQSEVGPSIEDPFDSARNLGSCMNLSSLARLKEELVRGHELCSNGCSLSQLLEPWAPALEEAAGPNADLDEIAEDCETVQEL